MLAVCSKCKIDRLCTIVAEHQDGHVHHFCDKSCARRWFQSKQRISCVTLIGTRQAIEALEEPLGVA
jgi:hypothetical protein